MNHLALFLPLALFTGALRGDHQPHQHPAVLEKVFFAHSKPRRTMLLSAQVAGPLHTIDLDLGEIGDGLKGFQIDPNPATLKRNLLQNQIKIRESELQAQTKRTRQAEIELNHQKKELARIMKMNEGGGATTQALQRQEHSVQKSLLFFEEQMATQELIKQQLKIAQVELNLQEDHLERYSEKAPLGWEVISRFKEAGEMVSPGQAILELAQLTPQTLDIKVDQAEAEAIRAGEVRVLLDGRSLKWTLHHLSPIVGSDSRKRRVQLLLTDLPPGETGREVRVAFSLPDPKGGLLVPDALILSAFGQKMVTTNSGDQLPIKVMRRSGDQWVISPDQIPPHTVLIPPAAGNPQP